ncbi:hypothetical protein [Microvirga vignae]|uniref:hypothetical protein n=1 Tax=Microvirga vignae TaxID=1225564 RepID=UPI000AD55B00|nr:hypothetical protein [Microvirga vignae]
MSVALRFDTIPIPAAHASLRIDLYESEILFPCGFTRPDRETSVLSPTGDAASRIHVDPSIDFQAAFALKFIASRRSREHRQRGSYEAAGQPADREFEHLYRFINIHLTL